MKLFGCLHIHRWHAIQKSRKIYPNTPETLLPLWCKGGGDEYERNMFCGGDVDQYLANYPKSGKSDRARRWVAKRYAKWWITDDYRTSGVNLYNKINPAQVMSCYIMITCCLLEIDCLNITKSEGNLFITNTFLMYV